jgi:hypothetical protein
MSFPTIDSSILWTLSGGGIRKSPKFNNKRQIPATGRGVYIVSLKMAPTWEYSVDLAYMVGTESSITDPYPLLMGLVMATNSAGFWYYNDPNDNTVTQETSCMLDVTSGSSTPMAQVGNGSSTQFQLARLIGSQGVDVLQNVSGTSVYVNGVLKTAGTDYSISSTGVVTFTSAPANNATLTWAGSFVQLCMWSEDTMADLALVAFNASSELHSVTGLKFETVLQ